METNIKMEDVVGVNQKILPTPHFVLVDDDPLFTRFLSQIARGKRIHLTTFNSAVEAYKVLPTMKFDVALLDYDLGLVTGVQLCHYLEHFQPDVPVVLVSHLENFTKEERPTTVFSAIEKKAGAHSILDSALKAYHGRRKEGEFYETTKY